MVELAVKVALGSTLAELGWGDGVLPAPAFFAVKSPAFSTAKLRGVDPSVGPGMQSTGEVIGIHADLRVAIAKALTGAALVPPHPLPGRDVAIVSIADRDKALAPRIGAALVRAGYRIAATPGTRAALARAGIAADPVAKVGAGPDAEGTPILDAIASGRTGLVVNTPTPRSGAVRDAAEIRLGTVAEGILCLTAAETAVAAVEALDPDLVGRTAEVRPLTDWVPDARKPREAAARMDGRGASMPPTLGATHR
jgi:carbamoyl-phosphate synthase large subunit